MILDQANSYEKPVDPEPQRSPPPATAAPSHFQVSEGVVISARGSGDTRNRDPAGERSSPSAEPGDASGPSPAADHAGFNFMEPRGGAARRDPCAPLLHQTGNRRETPPPPPLSCTPSRGGGWGSKMRKKKSNPPIRAKQTFLCHFLSSPGFRGRVLPGGLGCG